MNLLVFISQAESISFIIIIAVCLFSVEVSMSYHNFSLLFSFIVISAHVEVVTQLTKPTSYSQRVNKLVLLFHIVVVQCNLSV